MSIGIGDKLDNPIHCGPIYIQALKHHVKDKKMSRGFGRTNTVTRQPNKGRGWNGGLHFGEMEGDAALTSGSCNLVRERMMNMSDNYTGIFCRYCGYMLSSDRTGMTPCPLCKSTMMCKANVPHISQVITHILALCGIKLNRELEVYDHREIDRDPEEKAQIRKREVAYKRFLKGSRDPHAVDYVRRVLDGEIATSPAHAAFR